MSDYISFHDGGHSPSGKTKLWTVKNRRSGEVIGVVRWHGAWRRYCFFPVRNTVWSPGCLDTVSGFCRARTKEHKA